MKNSQRCVVVAGAEIKNYPLIKSYLKKDDYYIFCDCGLAHAQSLGVTPNLIVGDFDSHEKPNTDIETIVLPREKDDTDTVYAVKEALKRGFDDFFLVGTVGGRLDHTLGNVSILAMLYEKGKHAELADDCSVMMAVGAEPVSVTDNYPYFSVLNIFGSASGINIKNAKYPLSDGKITSDYQYGISNEVLPGEVAEVTVKNGPALLVKVIKA